MYQQAVKTFIEITKKYIENEKLTVVELGALDCKETMGFNSLLNKPTIFSFECNPNTLLECRKRVKKFKNIHLIEKAASNVNGKVKFYPIDQKKTITTWKNGNPGASSLFRASGKYPIEKYVQKEVEVDAITLKSFMQMHKLKHLDLLWMDIQGAELLALQGLGEKIKNVKFIYAEVEFFEIYKDQPLFENIKSFLDKNGFMLLGFTNLGEYAGDAIFVNKVLIPNLFKFIKIKLFGDQNLLWKGYRPVFLVKVNKFISKIYEKMLSEINTYRDRLAWKIKLINFHNKFGIEVDIGFNKYPSSKIKIDVIIPVARKDMEILPYCINSIKKFVRHPINKIFIISSKIDDIRTFCNTNGCTFVDEDTILPISKTDFKYNIGIKDRSGWLFQQLLKLSGDSISKLDNYLIVDADTIYIRPKVFEYKNKTIFDISDEYHQPYFETYKNLLGSDIFLPASFISHNMMINTSVLRELINKIEKRSHSKWYEAILKNIDKNEISSFSEQETYGSYMFQNYRSKMTLEYWYNFPLKGTNFSNIKVLESKYSSCYKTLSFHSYDR